MRVHCLSLYESENIKSINKIHCTDISVNLFPIWKRDLDRATVSREMACDQRNV